MPVISEIFSLDLCFSSSFDWISFAPAKDQVKYKKFKTLWDEVFQCFRDFILWFSLDTYM